MEVGNNVFIMVTFIEDNIKMEDLMVLEDINGNLIHLIMKEDLKMV
jgi:hypothetical protein